MKILGQTIDIEKVSNVGKVVPWPGNEDKYAMLDIVVDGNRVHFEGTLKQVKFVKHNLDLAVEKSIAGRANISRRVKKLEKRVERIQEILAE